jgi:hypothetical protein
LASGEVNTSKAPVDVKSRAEPSFSAAGIEGKMRGRNVSQLDGGNKDDSSS